MKLLSSLVCGVAFAGALIATPGLAQERSAAGSVEMQMTWTALSNLVQSAVARSEMVDGRVNNIVACSRKAMLYAPGAGADTDGCIENSKLLALTTRVNEINGEIATINGQVSALNSRMANAEWRLNDVDGKLSTQVGQINDLYIRDNQKAGQIGDLYGQSSDLYSNVNNIRTILSAMDGTLTNHTNRLNVQDSQINDLYNRDNQKAAQIAELYANVTLIRQCGASGKVLDGSTNQCRDIVEDVNRRIALINSQISTVNAQIADLNNRASAARGDIDYIKHCGANGMVLDGNTNLCRPPVCSVP